MRHARGVTDEPKDSPSIPGAHAQQTLPAAFLERLMLRINPHQPPLDAALLDAQRACGRWFALRRLRLGLSSEQLAGMADMPVEHLRMLEVGLADAGFVSAAARQRLSTFLKSGQEESGWVAEVIAIAAGQRAAWSAAIVERVLDDLDAADTQANRDRALTLELVEPALPERPIVAVAPALFEVLRVLIDGESYTYAIWEQVVRRFKHLGIAEVGELLERMRESDLIEEAALRLEPALDDEPLQFYRIAAAGRQAFNAERTRRALREAGKQNETQLEPGADTVTPFTNT